MGTLAGPSPIATNGQVTVPKHIMADLGWSGRDQVMFRVSDEDPEVLTLVPLAIFERRYSRGEAAEHLERMTHLTARARDRQGDS